MSVCTQRSGLDIERPVQPSISPEQQFVDQQRHQHVQRLLEDRLGARQQIQAQRQVGEKRQRQRVLAKQRSLEHIERQAAEEAERHARHERRHGRPVEHRQHQEGRTKHRQPARAAAGCSGPAPRST